MDFLKNRNGLRLAYVHHAGQEDGRIAVMFLGGFRSDMEGTKALFLEGKCKELGLEFVRFDYTGHGSSEGAFEGGSIGDWCGDAIDILDHVVRAKHVVLVGSSMGGWISLLMLLRRIDRVHGVVGIAAAPDFTREITQRLSEEQNTVMMRDGRVEIPNDYSDDPYVFTRHLIEDGEDHCVLDGTYDVDVPMIMVQGKADADVPWQKALRIQTCFGARQCDVVFVDDGDHRLSKPYELDLIWKSVSKVLSS